MVLIVNNDHKINLTKFENNSGSIFEYFSDKKLAFRSLKPMIISILLKIGMMKFLQNLHISLISKK